MPSPSHSPIRRDHTSAKPVLVPEDPGKARSRLERVKPWLDTLQSFLTIIGILAGCYWFYEQRSDKPNIKLDQTVTQRAIDGDPSHVLITVDVRATNIGKVKVDLESGKVTLMQINPVLADGSGSAPSITDNLKQIMLEPGESDQAIFRTVKLPDTVRTLQVSTSYAVPNTENYWTFVSAVDLGPHEQKKVADSSVQ